MANANKANVLIVDTSAQFDGQQRICGVKYIGNTNGTASIKADTTSGTVVYEVDGTADIFEDIKMYLKDGMYVTITNGAKLYIYLEA